MFRSTIRPIIFVVPVILLIIAAVLVRPALPSLAAGTSITPSLTYGPPTSTVQVKGNGFKGKETVLLTFDTTQGMSQVLGRAGRILAVIGPARLP